MNIALINQGGLAGSVVTTNGLAEALRRAGHTCEVFPYHSPNHLFLETAQVVIIEGMNPRFQEWPRLSTAKTIYWCLSFGGNPALPYTIPQQIKAMGYDGIMTNSAQFQPLAAKHIPTVYSQLAADPSVFAPTAHSPSLSADSVYIGCYPHKDPAQEALILKSAASAGSLAIYGKGWDRSPYSKYYRGPLPQDAVPVAYSSSRIALGMVEHVQAAWGMLNNRFYEVFSCGKSLIVPRSPATECLEEVAILVDSPRDVVSGIHSPPMDIDYRRMVLTYHTWDHRVGEWYQLFDQLLSGGGSRYVRGGRMKK